MIGDLYYNGYGVSKDYNGLGISCDYKKAMEWYQKAADNGNTDGMIKIGNGYTIMAKEYHRIIGNQWNGIRKQLIMGIQMV